jgi:hypothetical protein
MATVDDVYRRALRLLNVLDVGESPSGPQVDVAIPILNQMMARWEEDGIAVGWADVTSMAGTVPAPNSAIRGIAYNLAVDLAPEFRVTPSDEVKRIAVDDYAALQRDSIKNSIEPTDMSHLPGANGGRYDINSDS